MNLSFWDVALAYNADCELDFVAQLFIAQILSIGRGSCINLEAIEHDPT